MDERNDLELLLARVEEVRDAQKTYFKLRNDVNLAKSKAREAALDEVIKLMRKKGYDPEKFKVTPNKNELF